MRAVWQAWVALTARFGANDVDDVRRAMDVRGRPGPPWRYHVWRDAWIVLLFAWLPVGVILALAMRRGSGQPPGWQEAVLYGPTAVIGAATIWCVIATRFTPPPPVRFTRLPAAPRPPKRSKRQRAREEAGRASHVSSGRPQGPSPRRRPRPWVTALGVAALLGLALLRLWHLWHLWHL